MSINVISVAHNFKDYYYYCFYFGVYQLIDVVSTWRHTYTMGAGLTSCTENMITSALCAYVHILCSLILLCSMTFNS